jgi:hypothetical protein
MSFYQYSHWLITHDRITNNPGDRTDGIDKSYTINTTHNPDIRNRFR